MYWWKRKCALVLCLGLYPSGLVLDMFWPHGLSARLMVAAGLELAVESHLQSAAELAVAVGAALALEKRTEAWPGCC